MDSFSLLQGVRRLRINKIGREREDGGQRAGARERERERRRAREGVRKEWCANEKSSA